MALVALSVESGCGEKREPPSLETKAPCIPSRCRPSECALRTWPEPIPRETGWRLTASLDKERFRVDEPIYVTLVFENVSGESLSCATVTMEFDYIPYCRNELGIEPPPTCYGETAAFNRGRLKFGELVLPPGGYVIDRMLVTRFVDLSVVGKYTLKVARAALGEPKTLSNTCSFEVVDA